MDSREWLKEELELRRVRNPRFSLRAFARKVSLSPGHLSDLMSGNRLLTREVAVRLARGLGLPEEELLRIVPSQPSPAKPLGPLRGAFPHIPFHPLLRRDKLHEKVVSWLLESPPSRVQAIAGAPGSGKTILAALVVRDDAVRAKFTGGILWCDLRGAASEFEIWGRMCAALGWQLERADLADPTSRRRMLETRLRGARFLIVLDGLACPGVDPAALLLGGASCSHLITSRDPASCMKMSPEKSCVVGQLSDEEAVAVLAGFVPELRLGHKERLARLLRDFSRLPAAIVDVGYDFAKSHATEGPDWLARSMERLERGGMESSGLCLDSLSQKAMAAWERLSVFPPEPSTFSEEAALAIGSCTVATLDALCERGLLRDAGDDRLAFKPRPQKNTRTVMQRFVTFWLEQIPTLRQQQRLARLEGDNLAQALEFALALEDFLAMRQLLSLAAATLATPDCPASIEQAVKKVRSLAETVSDAGLIFDCLRFEACCALRSNRKAEARGLLMQALSCATGDDRLRAAADLLPLELYGGDPASAALRAKEISGVLATREPPADVAVAARTSLAIWEWEENQGAASYDLLLHAFRDAERIGDRAAQSRICRNLAIVAASREDSSEAARVLERAIALAEGEADSELHLSLLRAKIDLSSECGRYHDVVRDAARAIALARMIFHLAGEIDAQTQVAHARLQLGQYQEGYNAAKAALLLEESSPAPSRAVWAHMSAAHCAIGMGNESLVFFELEVCQRRISELPSSFRAYAICNLACVYADLERPVEARMHLESEVVRNALAGNASLRHDADAILREILLCEKRYQEVLAVGACEDGSAMTPRLRARLSWAKARAYRGLGCSEDARAFGEEAQKMFAELHSANAETVRRWLMELSDNPRHSSPKPAIKTKRPGSS